MEENKDKSTIEQDEQVEQVEQCAPIDEQEIVDEGNSFIEENEKLKKLADEYKDKWMRSVAEFDNYKKRTARQWSEAYDEGVASVIVKILPVGDNLDWALQLGLDEKTAEGIKKVKAKYLETLSSLEIEEIDPTGTPFDPLVAEAVMQVPAEDGEEPDMVKQVFQKGFKKKDKIIRYAKVSVIK